MSELFNRRPSQRVVIAGVMMGGGAPIVVQSMTNTDTADAASTVKQVYELAQAGSELVRITVNTPEAAAQVATMCRWWGIFITTVIACCATIPIARKRWQNIASILAMWGVVAKPKIRLR